MNNDNFLLALLGRCVGGVAIGFGIAEIWKLYKTGFPFAEPTSNYTFAYLILGGTICLLITEMMKRCK